MSQRYQLTVFNKAQDGHDLDVVKVNLAKQLKIPLSKLDHLLQKPFVLKKGLAQDETAKYVRFLDKLGIVYKITEEVSSTVDVAHESGAATSSVKKQEKPRKQKQPAQQTHPKRRNYSVFGSVLVMIVLLLGSLLYFYLKQSLEQLETYRENTFLAVGSGYACALTHDDKAICWGDNQIWSKYEPLPEKFQQISVGIYHV
jgi:hypothetical protein